MNFGKRLCCLLLAAAMLLSVPVYASAAAVLAVDVSTLPTKRIYQEWEALDVTGGELTVYYAGGSEVIPMTEDMVTGFDSSTVGPQSLTVSYQGAVCTYEIQVVPKTASGITVSTLPAKLTYLQGLDTLNVTGGELTVEYADGTQKTMPLAEATVTGFDNTVVGLQTLTVSYAGKTTSFQVEIVEKTLTGISVLTVPNKVKYMLHEQTLDVTGGQLLLTFDTGATEIVDITSDMVTGFHTETLGMQTLTVTYGEKTASYQIEVAEQIKTFSLTTLPGHTKYLVNIDPVDPTGGVLRVIYYDNSVGEIPLTAEMITGYDNTVLGVQTLTVTYGGATATYPVEICESNTVDFYGGLGTLERPYVIRTKEHLSNVRKFLDAHYVMIANLKFTEGDDFYNNGTSWDPIGTANAPFTGVFDGNGCSIEGVNIETMENEGGVYLEDYGLFGYTSAATIRNLNALNFTLTCTRSNSSRIRNKTAGVIAGYMDGGTISNCYSTGTVTLLCYNGDTHVGGIVGYMNGGSITGSCSASDISSKNRDPYWNINGSAAYAGGIAGYAAESSTIIDCYNIGTVLASHDRNDEMYIYSGGIVGYIGENGVITGCHNTGSIFAEASSYYHSSSSAATNAYSYAGGIGGKMVCATITECYNTGSISAQTVNDYTRDIEMGKSNLYAYAGGISAGEDGGFITGCTNSGEVGATVTRTSYYGGDDEAYSGGVAGYLDGAGIIEESCNEGYVLSESARSAYSGGIAGEILEGGITACSNKGNISAPMYAGGIAGDGGTITNCYNAGNVSSLRYAGGILNLNGTVSCCYNIGNLYSESSARGVGGGYISDCFNAGNIVAASTVYGIGGSYEATNCYNVGVLTAKSVYAIGERVTVTNCYYLNSTGSAADFGTACTMAQLQLQSTFAGFDFSSVWTMKGHADYLYPELRKVSMEYTKALASIALTTLPDKLLFTEGAALDVTGGALTLTYDNGTTQVIPMTAAMVTGFDNTLLDTQILTVTYQGYTATYQVEVVKKALASLEITATPTKLTYLEGKDALDVTGGMLKLTYNDGSTRTLAMTAGMVSGFDNTRVGKQTLKVTCEGKAASYSVEVIAKSLVSIAVTTLPRQLTLVEGTALDFTGGKLTLTYNNGTTQVIDLENATASGFDNQKLGQQTVTVIYGGKVTTYSVEVVARSLVSIAVTTLPDSCTVVEGTILDLTGGKLTVTYDNGTTQVLDLDLGMLLPFDSNTVGIQTVGVTYGGKSDAFSVEVVAKSLVSIALEQLPAKLTYLEGQDALDVTGGKLILTYNNGTTERIALTTSMVSGFQNTRVGEQTLTVTYQGQKTSYQVEVTEKTLVSIAITTLPTKLTYLEGWDALDVTGGKLTLTYDNGSSRTVDMMASMVTGFDHTQVGTQTLTVTYSGKKASFQVEILERSLESISVAERPAKLTYLEGAEELDITGGQLKLTYNNGTSELLDMTADMVTGFDNTQVGVQTLTVTYQGKKTSYPVEITEKTLLTMVITALPAKQTYLEGQEALDVTGGQLKLTYNNGTSELLDMTADMVTGFDNTQVGMQTLTVTYAGKTASFQVEILAFVHVHSWVADTVVEPSCTEGGCTVYICTCGESWTGDYTSALGHSMGAWVVTREPNYLENGEQKRTCSGCGMADVQVINNNPFTDVGDSNRFKTAILWAYYNNITSGTNKEGTLFSPDATVTRGQFVMFLWRLAGKPEPTITESPFPDVQGNNSFRKAVLWAVEKGITAGQKDGTFGLNNPCTRGQVVAFLYRYAGSPEYTTDREAFPDVSANNSFYKAVMWAVEMGITSGQSDGTFGLKGTCKRVHAVTFLYRYATSFQLVAPVQGEISMDFSMVALIYNPTTRDWRTHNGVDITAEVGTSVCAAADGTVQLVYKDGEMGYTVVISHFGGYTTTYSSLEQDIPVAEGDFVQQGQVIGSVGQSALVESASPAHLHFTVEKDGEALDPKQYVTFS